MCTYIGVHINVYIDVYIVVHIAEHMGWSVQYNAFQIHLEVILILCAVHIQSLPSFPKCDDTAEWRTSSSFHIFSLFWFWFWPTGIFLICALLWCCPSFMANPFCHKSGFILKCECGRWSWMGGNMGGNISNGINPIKSEQFNHWLKWQWEDSVRWVKQKEEASDWMFYVDFIQLSFASGIIWHIVGLKGLKAICGDISLVVLCLWHWKQCDLNAAFMWLGCVAV